ncbi:unnamed protein product, partial [Choristocarpus tenellus]
MGDLWMRLLFPKDKTLPTDLTRKRNSENIHSVDARPYSVPVGPAHRIGDLITLSSPLRTKRASAKQEIPVPVTKTLEPLRYINLIFESHFVDSIILEFGISYYQGLLVVNIIRTLR